MQLLGYLFTLDIATLISLCGVEGSETEQREIRVAPISPTLLIKHYICTRLKVNNMKHLTNEQRYQIKAYLDCGKTKTFIAIALNVHKSTIGRELKRNSKKTRVI